MRYQFESLAVTREKFLWSPTTAVSDPKSIIDAMRQEFVALGGQVDFERRIELKFEYNEVRDGTDFY